MGRRRLFVRSGELNAAFLWAQFEAADHLKADRLRAWWPYHEALEPLEEAGFLRRPVSRSTCSTTDTSTTAGQECVGAHAAPRGVERGGVNAVFHYVPLHDSVAGRRYGRPHGALSATDDVSGRVIRLPLFHGMDEGQIGRVVELLVGAARKATTRASAAV